MIDVLYRSRQKENLDKDVLNFLSSLNEDINIISYDILGTQSSLSNVKQNWNFDL